MSRGEIPVRLSPTTARYCLLNNRFSTIIKEGVKVQETKSLCNSEQPGASGQNPLENITTYTIKGKTIIVEPVFKENSQETLGTILMRLMHLDK